MTLRFDARLASRGFDVALEVADGETVAVLGPLLVAPLVRHTERILDTFPAMERRR